MSASSDLAVCSWSLRPTDPQNLIKQLGEIGIQRIQIALDPLRENPAVWSSLPELCAKNGITFVSGMIGTVGEDYTTLESIKRTGGVVPDSTWDQNWKNFQSVVPIAKKLGLKLITLHAGFLPHDTSDPNFMKLLARVVQTADLFGANGIELGFETGQETAEALRTFLQHLKKPSVGVNFDPANIILYGNGDPIAALRLLGPWLKQCHIKDATKTKKSGTWGEEVVVGTGEVNWHAFFETAKQVGFKGDFCIEREAGEQRVADIKTAKNYLGTLTK